jgi:hypothetical protein
MPITLAFVLLWYLIASNITTMFTVGMHLYRTRRPLPDLLVDLFPLYNPNERPIAVMSGFINWYVYFTVVPV